MDDLWNFKVSNTDGSVLDLKNDNVQSFSTRWDVMKEQDDENLEHVYIVSFNSQVTRQSPELVRFVINTTFSSYSFITNSCRFVITVTTNSFSKRCQAPMAQTTGSVGCSSCHFESHAPRAQKGLSRDIFQLLFIAPA